MNKKKIIDEYLPKNILYQEYGNLIAYEVAPEEIVKTCKIFKKLHGLPLKIITAFDERSVSKAFKIFYVFGIPEERAFIAPYILVQNEFPSISEFIHEASIYERKIKSFFGLEPKGHPAPRSLILHENWPADAYPLRKDFAWNKRPAEANTPFEFRRFGGEGVYEIPVGPVHAGIIEPGHFRFSMAGEEILMLEPRLGYSHKGTEKLFETLPMDGKLKLSERVSGDSSFSHSLAFCQAVEQLADIEVLREDSALRVIFCELERLANHFGDIGAIMIDTGFNFGGAHGARLREVVMQINESLTGNRFLRGVNEIGGVSENIPAEVIPKFLSKLDALQKDFSEVIEVAEESRTLENRLRGTGTLNKKIAEDHAVSGVAARAVGINADTRRDYPYAAYGQLDLGEAIIETTGDVRARFKVRIREVYASIDILKQTLLSISKGISKQPEPIKIKLKNNSYSVAVVEGWRGEIFYMISTDAEGNISRVAVRDPSFLNWTAVGHAGKGNIVPDFPLINKSFNLSYSGNDL